MHTSRTLLAALAVATPALAQTTTSQPAPHELLKFSYTAPPTSPFPGTVRDITVYVPAQYDPAKLACLFVDQDGVQFKSPDVFDQLIASHDMPITIGVYVAPGKVPAANGNALPRFNRSYEFDTLSPDYATFLLKEILPLVESKTTADGRPIHLSKDPNDRMIAGSSSGGIAAFTAAWEHPESFHRVFTCIGTYVDLRGGNIYPSLVRKFEPKPLRIFLEDGSTDHNHYGGDWWMANQELERALTFAGYEVNHLYGDHGHESKFATEHFAEIMKWMWHDYPTPIKTGLGSEQLQQILIPGEGWQVAGDGYKGTDGPAVTATGELFFNGGSDRQIEKVDLDGKIAEFADDAQNNGAAIAPDGKLYELTKTQMLAYDPARTEVGGAPQPVANDLHGNDIAIAHNGNMYVTESYTKPTDVHKLWLFQHQEDGSFKKMLADTGLKDPDGVCLSPDQTLLYLNDYRSHWVYSFTIQPDGTLANKQKFYDLYVPDAFDDSGADGMRTDRDGRLWVCTRAGIQVCDQAGRVVAIIPTPNGKCSNLAFAGENFDTLYVTAGNVLYKRHVKVKGANAWDVPVKPAAPKL